MSYFSFSLAVVLHLFIIIFYYLLYIYSSLYEKDVAWIKIHIQSKSFSLNIKK